MRRARHTEGDTRENSLRKKQMNSPGLPRVSISKTPNLSVLIKKCQTTVYRVFYASLRYIERK